MPQHDVRYGRPTAKLSSSNCRDTDVKIYEGGMAVTPLMQLAEAEWRACWQMLAYARQHIDQACLCR